MNNTKTLTLAPFPARVLLPVLQLKRRTIGTEARIDSSYPSPLTLSTSTLPVTFTTTNPYPNPTPVWVRGPQALALAPYISTTFVACRRTWSFLTVILGLFFKLNPAITEWLYDENEFRRMILCFLLYLHWLLFFLPFFRRLSLVVLLLGERFLRFSNELLFLFVPCLPLPLPHSYWHLPAH